MRNEIEIRAAVSILEARCSAVAHDEIAALKWVLGAEYAPAKPAQPQTVEGETPVPAVPAPPRTSKDVRERPRPRKPAGKPAKNETGDSPGVQAWMQRRAPTYEHSLDSLAKIFPTLSTEQLVKAAENFRFRWKKAHGGRWTKRNGIVSWSDDGAPRSTAGSAEA